MINHDNNLFVGHQWLKFGSKLADKCGLIVDGNVGNDIDREHIVLLGIVETMHLDDFRMGSKHLHHLCLQFCTTVLAGG